MPRRTRSATRESADDEAPDEFDQASAKQSALEAAEREEAAQAAQAAAAEADQAAALRVHDVLSHVCRVFRV